MYFRIVTKNIPNRFLIQLPELEQNQNFFSFYMELKVEILTNQNLTKTEPKVIWFLNGS